MFTEISWAYRLVEILTIKLLSMIPKKNPEIEVGRNSSLYFAIGLNVMLFLSWQALEYKTYDDVEITREIVQMEQEIEEEIPIVTVDVPPPPPPPVAMQENVQIVADTEEVEETVFESTEVSQDDVIQDVVRVDEIDVDEVEEYAEVPFAIIEDVPLYPGCENVKKSERRACFQKMLNAHVKEHFSYPQVALDMGLKGRVFVIFVIDPKGNITQIRTRGPAEVLEDEAHRIVSLLPRMTPGKQRGKPVSVPFSLPINFVLANQ